MLITTTDHDLASCCQILKKYPSLDQYARYNGYKWPIADVMKAHLKYTASRHPKEL